MQFTYPVAITALFLTAASASTIVTIDPNGNLPVILTVTAFDIAIAPPLPGNGIEVAGEFEDIFLIIRDPRPPLAFGPGFVFQVDSTMGQQFPPNVSAFAVNLPRTPATYHLSIGN